MAVAAEANLSDLLNKPKATLAKLASNRRLLLRRRDDEDLVITTAERAAQDTAVVRDTTRLFREMMRRDPAVMALAVQVLPSVFPWVRHLPEDAWGEFAAEWLDTLSAATELDNNAAVEGVIAAWRHTAEIYADPELYAIATRRHDTIENGERVPRPEVPG
jgi:hypothetical protein